MNKQILLVCLLGLSARSAASAPTRTMNSQCFGGRVRLAERPARPARDGTGHGRPAAAATPNGAIIGIAAGDVRHGDRGLSARTCTTTPANTNLGDPASGDGADADVRRRDGSPDPGSLKVVAPYTGANQYVDIQKSMTTDAAGLDRQDAARPHQGRRRARYPGGAQVYAITVPNQYVFGGTFTNVAKNNNWQEFTVNLDNPMTRELRLRPGAGDHRRRSAQHRQRGRAARRR